jgi:hypothetical protein
MPDLEVFREEVQGKIKNLLKEFGAGKISNEQFDILYERYNNQLEMANSALDTTQEQMPGANMSTIAIRKATTGKAVGLGIYHHRSGTIIETLGNFDVPPQVMSPVLNEFSDKLEMQAFIEAKTQKLDARHWVVFMAREYTTVIVIFRNEPAPAQIQQMKRLQHDFENANERFLKTNQVDADKLARPFMVFVKKRLRR